MSSRTIQSLARALDVLELYSLSERELGVKEISERLELAKSTVHGLIKTMANRGYLEQNPITQKYKLGLRLFELGRIVKYSMDFRTLAYPIIKQLSMKVKETVHLTVWNGSEATYIEKMEGMSALRMNSMVGRSVPLYCTGVGKAIFAFLSEQEQQHALAQQTFTSFTVHTITSSEVLLRELHRVKEQGYAEDNEEIEIGLKCIAAPIFDYTGGVIGSISCSGPKQRMDEIRTDLIPFIKQAAIDISKKNGYSEHSPYPSLL